MKIKTGSYALDYFTIVLAIVLSLSIVVGIMTRSFSAAFGVFAFLYLIFASIILPLGLLSGDNYEKGNE
jgi:hypothetical protein